MVGKGKGREESSRKKGERKAMVFWSLRSFITTISCAKTAVTYFGYLVPLPPRRSVLEGRVHSEGFTGE